MSDDKSDSEKPSHPPFIAVLVAIYPPPLRAADEFTLRALSATEGYSVDAPIIVGQYPLFGAQSLTVQLRIQPAPPPKLNLPPRFADGWPEEPAIFAAVLRNARQEAGLTQTRLASLSGYSEMTIRNIETYRYAANAECRRRLIEAIARADIHTPTFAEAHRQAAHKPFTPSDSPTNKQDDLPPPKTQKRKS